ncbi:MAG: gamma-glutamylcyclotransferase family protein [Gemmatimonadaceae bacterium]
MQLYFAYGSNMDVSQMEQRCPGAVCRGVGTLADHRFVINRRGVATLVPHPGGLVHGLLWALTPDHVASLDHYEGVREGRYVQDYVEVQAGEGPATALVYLATDATAGTPRPGYLEMVVRAARELQLPAGYFADLERCA